MGNSGGKGSSIGPPPGDDPKILNEASAETAAMFTTTFDADSPAKFLFSEEYDTKTENYEMPNQTFTLGRATKNDLVVSRYNSISRKHIQMAVSDGECQMTVLGAAGTQLFMGRTLSALNHEEAVSLNGSGMIKCGDELLLCFTTAKKCEHIMLEIIEGQSFEGAATMWTTGAKLTEFGIGRKAKHAITLPKNSISGNHLEFERIAKGDLKGWWTVCDVSSNGTTLNNRWKMVKRAKYLVIPGMTLSLGDEDERIKLLVSGISEDGNGGARTDITDQLPTDIEAFNGEED